MRFDLLFVSRRRLYIPFDPAARVLSFTIKRSYAQHATQASPPSQNTLPPPAIRRRAGPFPSLHPSSEKFVDLKSIESRPSPSSPKPPSLTSSKSKKKKKSRTVKTCIARPLSQRGIYQERAQFGQSFEKLS